MSEGTTELLSEGTLEHAQIELPLSLRMRDHSLSSSTQLSYWSTGRVRLFADLLIRFRQVARPERIKWKPAFRYVKVYGANIKRGIAVKSFKDCMNY